MKKKMQPQSVFDYRHLLMGGLVSLFLVSQTLDMTVYEKIGSLALLFFIIIGMEFLNYSMQHPPRKTRRKQRKSLDSIDFHWSDILTPSFVINFFISFTIGGLMGYSFLGSNHTAFFSTGLLLFICLVGIELIFLDCHPVSLKQIKTVFIPSIMEKISYLAHEKKPITVITCTTIGIALSTLFYPGDTYFLIFSGLSFMLTGFGVAELIDSFTKKK